MKARNQRDRISKALRAPYGFSLIDAIAVLRSLLPVRVVGNNPRIAFDTFTAKTAAV
ncbi:hypothetical protein [Ochrobactrum sp. BTU1]|uniref:hypothetical protein n=1 Tax=Ochrobactrum sp. BTU1 TaxID=2840456 RepID=UPI001C04D281|nr:hypothetical protein KMS41_27380 [Ochrobactrum sp. BTU1]